MTTNNNYAIFIISHNRASEQKTLKALEKANYKGKYFIVIDSLDNQKEEYLKKYKENIIIFEKSIIYDQCDTMDNFHNFSSALYSRNFVIDTAKKMKLDFFMLFDDDIEYFCVRYDDNGKLKRKEILDINKLFDEYINYMKSAKITCIGFGNEGGYFGGTKGKFAQRYGRSANQAMILNAKDNIKYIGTQNEDINICYKFFDKLFLEIYQTSIFTPKRGSNDGGNDYNTSNLYCSNFYSVMLAPAFNKIRIKGNNITLIKKWNKAVPKIINEVYKKWGMIFCIYSYTWETK